VSERISVNSYEELYNEFVILLSDLLVVPLEEIEPQSLLVDDLDADSVSFLELSYMLNERFGIQMAEVKVDEETLNMNLVSGLEKLNRIGGDVTFFEHVKAEAIRRLLTVHATADGIAGMLLVTVPQGMDPMTPVKDISLIDLKKFGVTANWDSVDESVLQSSLADTLPTVDLATFFPQETRERLFRAQRVEDLVLGIQGRVPDDISPSTPLNQLLLRDLFRFLTVGAMARYLWDVYRGANTTTPMS